MSDIQPLESLGQARGELRDSEISGGSLGQTILYPGSQHPSQPDQGRTNPEPMHQGEGEPDEVTWQGRERQGDQSLQGKENQRRPPTVFVGQAGQPFGVLKSEDRKEAAGGEADQCQNWPEPD